MKDNSTIKSYPAGTIVLQYINDSTEIIGVAVGNHMSNRLSDDDKKMFDLYLNKSEPYHCLLVLGFNCRYASKEPLQFRNPKYDTERFPWYKVGQIDKATPIDFEQEIANLKFYRNEPVSNGLISARLRSLFFAPNPKQAEIIELAVVIKHYMEGGNFENKPEVSFGNIKLILIYEELARAIPRS